MTDATRGHRCVPHTADLRIEAWAPTSEGCIAEAVLGLVESFADVTGVRPTRVARFCVPEGPAEEMLLAALDDVIYRLDVHGEVPVDVEVATSGGTGDGAGGDVGGGVDLRLALAGAGDVEPVGAPPKGVTLHGLRFAAGHGQWSCSVTVDV